MTLLAWSAGVVLALDTAAILILAWHLCRLDRRVTAAIDVLTGIVLAPRHGADGSH